MRLRNWTPLLASALVIACSGGEPVRMPPPEELASAIAALDPALETAPELKKVVPQAPPVPPFKPKQTPWTYMLAADYGIRTDKGGEGSFLSPRAHGKHNGIDFLAPVGAPVLAACSGKARSDERGGYGNVVQLVCRLPDSLGGDEGLHVSLFYAHLSKANVGKKWVEVTAGTKLGAVGKTGNAKGPKIKPHLHFEIIVRGSEEDAIAERHSGVVPKANEPADRFFELLKDECLTPAAFAPQGADIRRERRADPFLMLMCLGKPKPELTTPDKPDLRSAQVKWSAHYTAGGFDVDRGPR